MNGIAQRRKRTHRIRPLERCCGVAASIAVSGPWSRCQRLGQRGVCLRSLRWRLWR